MIERSALVEIIEIAATGYAKDQGIIMAEGAIERMTAAAAAALPHNSTDVHGVHHAIKNAISQELNDPLHKIADYQGAI